MKKLLFFFLLLLQFTQINAQYVDTISVKNHLINITKTIGFRTYSDTALLNKTAHYIDAVFKKYSTQVYFQIFTVNGKQYKNVICSFGTENKARIIVGAHYDVCGEQEGADDNASGIVGLLELAKLLQGKKLNNKIDLVAYTLEEPPYFRTENMGSYVHSKMLSDSAVNVKGMVCLEMLGYFKDEKKTQDYPVGILSLFYGNKGNYITLVKKFGAGKFARQFAAKFKQTNSINTKKFKAPASLQGIDFSDHLNYWKFGFSALMITDTSFYRNHNYHHKTDILETLDLVRMAKVIDGVYLTLLGL
jgi:Peptidase family M28